MKILVAGASGMVGAALTGRSSEQVVRLVRHPARNDGEIEWDPAAGELDAAALEGMDAVVCLSGESIFAARWTESKKARIRDSRLDTAGLLARTMAGMNNPPSVFVCASATGYYGIERGKTPQRESSPAGDGFLAGVCKDWEAAAEPAREKGIRVAHLRFGIVLSQEGGALKTMLTPFRLGLGGVVGSGEQCMSWVALDDVVDIIQFVLNNESMSGPINVVAPNTVSNRNFTKTLGRVLNRPTVLPAPAFAIKAALGEMGEELLLGGVNAVPEKLADEGYAFQHPELEPALRNLLEA